MQKSIFIALTLIAGLTQAGWAQDPVGSGSFPATAAEIQPGTVTEAQTFADTAAVANLFEIQSSELALTRASSEAAKSFAQHMIDDHSKAGDELATAAGQQGVTLPTALDQAHLDKLAQLQAATDADFDGLYIKMQTEAHVEAVALFSGYAKGGEAGPVRDFAAATLPTLEKHYEEVRALE